MPYIVGRKWGRLRLPSSNLKEWAWHGSSQLYESIINISTPTPCNMGSTAHGVNCHGVNCHGVNCPWGQLPMGANAMGSTAMGSTAHGVNCLGSIVMGSTAMGPTVMTPTKESRFRFFPTMRQSSSRLLIYNPDLDRLLLYKSGSFFWTAPLPITFEMKDDGSHFLQRGTWGPPTQRRSRLSRAQGWLVMEFSKF